LISFLKLSNDNILCKGYFVILLSLFRGNFFSFPDQSCPFSVNNCIDVFVDMVVRATHFSNDEVQEDE
jgi:hypothetical protein